MITAPTTHVETLIASIRRHGDSTIPALLEVLASHGVPTEGECVIHAHGRPNLLLWAGMSEEARDILMELNADPRTTVKAVSFLVFLLDGMPILNLPIAQQPHLTRDYVSPRWVPAVVDLVDRTRKKDGNR